MINSVNARYLSDLVCARYHFEIQSQVQIQIIVMIIVIIIRKAPPLFGNGRNSFVKGSFKGCHCPMKGLLLVFITLQCHCVSSSISLMPQALRFLRTRTRYREKRGAQNKQACGGDNQRVNELCTQAIDLFFKACFYFGNATTSGDKGQPSQLTRLAI